MVLSDDEFFAIARREIGTALRDSATARSLHLERDRAESVRSLWRALCRQHGRCEDTAYHRVFDDYISFGDIPTWR